MRQEYNIRTAVEEERRQLLLALSLEQRDQLEASAKLHILRDKGKAVESELQTQFQLFGDEYERYIAGKIHIIHRSSLSQRLQPAASKKHNRSYSLYFQSQKNHQHYLVCFNLIDLYCR